MAGKGFRFRFQKILDVREQQQKALEVQLAQSDEAVATCCRELQHWRDMRHHLLDQIGRFRADANLEEARRCAEYLGHVRKQVATARGKLQDLRRQREEVRAELAEVLKSHKMLENYRERLKQEFASEQEKVEQMNLELHAVRKFIQAEGIA